MCIVTPSGKMAFDPLWNLRFAHSRQVKESRACVHTQAYPHGRAHTDACTQARTQAHTHIQANDTDTPPRVYQLSPIHHAQDLQASTAPAVAAKRKASSRGWRLNLCGTGGSTGYADTPRRSKRQHQPEDKQGQEKSSEGNAPPGVVMSPDETNVPSSVPTPDVNPFAAEPQVHAAPWKARKELERHILVTQVGWLRLFYVLSGGRLRPLPRIYAGGIHVCREEKLWFEISTQPSGVLFVSERLHFRH